MLQPPASSAQQQQDVHEVFWRHPLVSFGTFELCIESHTLQAILLALPARLCSLRLNGLSFGNARDFARYSWQRNNAVDPLRPQILQAIQRFSTLQRLDLSAWKLTSQEVASLVPHLPELRHLCVGAFDNSPLTDDGLVAIARHCPQLRHLNIQSTAVTPAGVIDLLKSLQLFELELCNTSIGPEHLRDIVMASQTLRIVSFGWNEFETTPAMQASLDAADEACGGATLLTHMILGPYRSKRNRAVFSNIKRMNGGLRLSTHDPYNLSPDEWHSVSLVRCSSCNVPSRTLKRCSRCRSVRYCGPACQRTAWPTHRIHCKPSQ